MTIALISTSGATKGSSGTSLTCPLPTGWAAGDTMYMMCAATKSTGGVGTISAPAGWSAVATNISASVDVSILVSKVLTAGETAPVLTLSSTATAGVVSAVVRDSSLDSIAATYYYTGSTTILTYNSITTVAANTLQLGFGIAFGGNGTQTPPSGWTEYQDMNSGSGVSVFLNAANYTNNAGNPTGNITASTTTSSRKGSYRIALTQAVPPFIINGWGMPL